MATRNNLCASVGEWVLLNTSDERQLMVQATLSGKVRLSKKKSCSTAPLVGARFGSVFELVGRDLTPVEGDLLLDLTSSAAEATASASSTEATAAGQQSTTDNRELVDDNSAQTLPPEEIERMKKEGASGRRIVDALVAHSATFAGKTIFSQAKYLKRKQQKYIVRVRVVRCSIDVVAEFLFARSQRKLHGLRWDSLAQMISCADVRAGARVAVVDGCGGLLTASCAARTGGFGEVMNIYCGKSPGSAKEWVGRTSMPQVARDSVRYVALADLLEGGLGDEVGRVDCLLIAAGASTEGTPLDPAPLIRALLPLLAPSRPFAVFSLHHERLAAAMLELRRLKTGACTSLFRTWSREIQVLHGRTHPTMRMHDESGCVLTGMSTLLDAQNAATTAAAAGAATGATGKRKREAETTTTTTTT